MTSTSPGSVAPATIWSHSASIVPPVITVLVPGRIPAACPIGTTRGICASSTPKEARRSAFHRPRSCKAPRAAVTPVSMAGIRDSAQVATAWQGQ